MVRSDSQLTGLSLHCSHSGHREGSSHSSVFQSKEAAPRCTPCSALLQAGKNTHTRFSIASILLYLTQAGHTTQNGVVAPLVILLRKWAVDNKCCGLGAVSAYGWFALLISFLQVSFVRRHTYTHMLSLYACTRLKIYFDHLPEL